ncbi:MAG: hypothetical protein V7765_06965 [Oleispira sp.]
MKYTHLINAPFKLALLPLAIGVLAGCMDSDKKSDSKGEQSPEAIGEPVVLTIDTTAVRNTVSESFLSVALDMSQQVSEINFWDDEGVFDFNRQALLNMAKQLSPGYLRVGGTDADKTFYQVGAQKDTALPEHYEGTLTEVQTDNFFAFAKDAGLDVIFGVNAGPGTRDQDGAWLSSNSDSLMEYIESKDYAVAAWELGNEPGLMPTFHLGFEVPPAQLADDHVVFRNRLADSSSLFVGPDEAFAPLVGEISLTTDSVNNLDAFYPDAFKAALLPGAHFRTSPYLKDYLTALPEGTLDALTWHYYPQQSVRCPLSLPASSAELLLDPEKLNDIKQWIGQVSSYRDLYQANAEIWLGETGNAQCGGQIGISDRFVSSFWWLDELGVLAQNDNDVAIRQTLAGSEYGLIDNLTLQPRSDYWASVLWKMNMGHKVLSVSQDTDENLRVYAHCHPTEQDTLSLLAINLDATTAFALDTSAWAGKETQQYVMTADQLDSKTIKINGHDMTVDANGDFTIPAKQLIANDAVDVDARSMAFIQIKNAGVQACK